MNLELTPEQAQDLNSLLDLALKEMSHEIAATDNAGYRSELVARRHRLAEVTDALRGLVAGGTTPTRTILPNPDPIVRELAHPGD